MAPSVRFEGERARGIFVPLLILSCIVLLPVFPAYFLFKALPTASGSVSGTLAGLKIKLGGAFAGYFAVVLLVFLAHDIWNPVAYQVWEVSGQVTDETGRTIEPLDVKDILLVPPTFQYSPGGHFTLTFATMPAPGGGMKYPTLSVNYPDFQVATIPLDPAAAPHLDANVHLERDETRRQINIQRVILRKLPAYLPTGKAPPAPVSAAEEIHQ